jgi:hypothetical protein
VEALLAFAAALLALRLAGDLMRRFRVNRAPQLAAWAGSLFAYSLASAALAWGSAAGWDEISFRVYYLAGGLLTAPLLGAGSLLLRGKRWAGLVALLYMGLAVGVAIAVPLVSEPSGTAIPEAQAHLEFFPARFLAVVANTVGTLAVVVVALLTIRHRPLGNALIIAGVLVAGIGSALAGLGTATTAAFVAVGALLLYAGFLSASGERLVRSTPRSRRTSPA